MPFELEITGFTSAVGASNLFTGLAQCRMVKVTKNGTEIIRGTDYYWVAGMGNFIPTVAVINTDIFVFTLEPIQQLVGGRPGHC